MKKAEQAAKRFFSKITGGRIVWDYSDVTPSKARAAPVALLRRKRHRTNGEEIQNMGLWIVEWYCIGIVGTILAHSALRAYDSVNEYKYEPVKVKTVVFCAFVSLFGPVAILIAIELWIFVAFERHPIWTWGWVQPIKRVLNYQLFERRSIDNHGKKE